MKVIHNIAIMIEEASRYHPALSAIVDFVLKDCAADHMWGPIRFMLYQPNTVVLYTSVVYLVFCIIYLPFFFISFLVGGYGAFLVFLLSLALLARAIARSMTFPGSGASMQRDAAVDFLRRMSIQLEKIAVSSSEMMSFLLVTASSYKSSDTSSGSRPSSSAKNDVHSIEHQYRELGHYLAGLSKFLMWITRATEAIKGRLTPSEIQTMQKLVDSLSIVLSSHSDLSPILMPVVRECYYGPPAGSNGRKTQLLETFIKTSSKYLQASESLKAAALAIRPKVEGNAAGGGGQSEGSGAAGAGGGGGSPMSQEEALMAAATQVLFPKKISSHEHLSFAVMREQLFSNYGAERISVLGNSDNANFCDKNTIDMLYIPCAANFAAKKASSRGGDSVDPSTEDSMPSSVFAALSSTPISTLGTVVMCAPNAGLYEGLSQHPKDGSWVGVYTKLGFDVCVWNYRGYNESTGVPTPYRMKKDACTLVDYIVEVKGVSSIILHGESVGGMVAAHVASHSKHREQHIRMLICDKSFASLDAVAARMLGKWVSPALRYVGHWFTNEAMDFLHTTCPKVILQDPNDEIIAHSASLKVGVAATLVLGDRYFTPRSLPNEYIIANFLNEAIPYSDQPLDLCDLTSGGVSASSDREGSADEAMENGMASSDGKKLLSTIDSRSDGGESGYFTAPGAISSAANLLAICGVGPAGRVDTLALLEDAGNMRRPLTEAFVDHLAASILFVGRHASRIARARKNRGSAEGGLAAQESTGMGSAAVPCSRSSSGSSSSSSSSSDGSAVGRDDTADEEDDAAVTPEHLVKMENLVRNSSLQDTDTLLALQKLKASAMVGRSVVNAGGIGSGSAPVGAPPRVGGNLSIDVESGASAAHRRKPFPVTPMGTPEVSNQKSGVGGWKEPKKGSSKSLPSTSGIAAPASSSSSAPPSTPAVASAWASVDNYSSRSVRDDGLSVVEKVWMVLSRLDGGTGQLLGQACHNSVDGVRAWVCGYVMYHEGNTVHDMQMPSNCSSMSMALQELNEIAFVSPGGLSNGEGGEKSISREFEECPKSIQNIITFIIVGLRSLQQRQQDVAQGNRSGLYNIVSLQPWIDYDRLYGRTMRVLSSVLQSASPAPNAATSPGSSTRPAASPSSPAASGAVSVGRVIPVHCGHNGWLSADNLAELKRLVRGYGGFAKAIEA